MVPSAIVIFRLTFITLSANASVMSGVKQLISVLDIIVAVVSNR